MNTKIIAISEDQNTITHESGVVTEFDSKCNLCFYCCYDNIEDGCIGVPCVINVRKDKGNGIFKLKTT